MEVYFGDIVEARFPLADYPMYADLILHLLIYIKLASSYP